jgi:hypothetical protein
LEESNCLGESDQERTVKGESIPIYRKAGVGEFLLESLSFSAVPKYYANSAGFIVAATHNYIWNRLWTFQSENEQIMTEYLSFITIH